MEPLEAAVDVVEEERAHYGYIVQALRDIEATAARISANTAMLERIAKLRMQVERWDTQLRAIEVRMKLPDS